MCRSITWIKWLLKLCEFRNTICHQLVRIYNRISLRVLSFFEFTLLEVARVSFENHDFTKISLILVLMIIFHFDDHLGSLLTMTKWVPSIDVQSLSTEFLIGRQLNFYIGSPHSYVPVMLFAQNIRNAIFNRRQSRHMFVTAWCGL